ncbi:MAG: oligosaccharide flippase family protein [Cryomorphaceae bacterium]|nr:oligosaccharide flippase family protein [Cryomorphaceae bacterium]
MQISKKHLILFDQAVFSGSSFLLTIIVARTLDVGSFGIYSGVILGLYLVLSAVGALVSQPFQVHILSQKNKSVYLSFAFWAQVTFGILLVIGLILANFIFDSPYLSFAILPFAFGFILHDFFRKALLALDRIKQTVILDVVAAFAQFFAILTFIFLGNAAVEKLFWFVGAAYFFPFILAIWFTKPLQFESVLWLTHAKVHVKDGKWLLSTALVQWWSGNIFVVASGVYLGAKALGALRLAQSLFGVLNVLLQTFENYVLPQTAGKINQSMEAASDYLGGVSRKAGLLFAPVIAAVLLFPETIFTLAGGEEYRSFAFVLRGLAVLYIFIYISQPIRIAIRALILNKFFFYGYLISLAFALLFGRYLLSNYELTGAIIGLIGSQFLLIVFWQIILHRRKFKLWKSFISF